MNNIGTRLPIFSDTSKKYSIKASDLEKKVRIKGNRKSVDTSTSIVDKGTSCAGTDKARPLLRPLLFNTALRYRCN